MTRSKVFSKTGHQSADDPFMFVMSSESTDRHGDIVIQNWKLASFKQNPIALFSHSHSQPIGTWTNVRVVGGKLMGKLQLAKQGTSELIDTLRSLVEQKILKAVSVGFRPGSVKAIDEKNPWDGSYLDKNELLECSLVSVGANQDALLQATKSMNLGDDTLDFLKAIKSDNLDTKTSKNLNPHSQVSDNKGSSKQKRNNGDKPMSLSERIKALQARITASNAEADSIYKDADNDDNRDLNDDEMDQIDMITDDIEKAQRQLDTLLKREKSITSRIKSEFHKEESESDESVPAMSGARARSANIVKGHKALAVMSAIVTGHVTQRNAVDVAVDRYKDEPEIAALVKASSAPARAGTSGWAQELVEDTWGEFLELLRDNSIYSMIPGPRMNFDGYGKITLPRQGGRGTLGGGFIAEGGAIPVKKGAIDSVDLTPKGMKVISTFTREIAMRSNPSIEQMIREQILGDTAEVLDAHIMGSTARDTINPGGFQDTVEIGAANINTSAGSTAANIQSDTKAMISALVTNRFTSAVWIMNPVRVLSLRDLQDAASGVFLYKDELDSGMFRGFPFISSGNVPSDVVALVANDAVAFASEYGPMIDASNSASLHFEDTTPLDIGTAGTPNVVAAPVKSLFQTDSIALRMTMGLDHRLVRANGVQILDTVAW